MYFRTHKNGFQTGLSFFPTSMDFSSQKLNLMFPIPHCQPCCSHIKKTCAESYHGGRLTKNKWEISKISNKYILLYARREKVRGGLQRRNKIQHNLLLPDPTFLHSPLNPTPGMLSSTPVPAHCSCSTPLRRLTCSGPDCLFVAVGSCHCCHLQLWPPKMTTSDLFYVLLC